MTEDELFKLISKSTYKPGTKFTITRSAPEFYMISLQGRVYIYSGLRSRSDPLTTFAKEVYTNVVKHIAKSQLKDMPRGYLYIELRDLAAEFERQAIGYYLNVPEEA